MDDAAYDAVVVGGRVAGSTTAALLGMRGVRVLLVERVPFPRSTISTHFFRGAGLVAVLERLGILERVLALGPPLLTREFSYGFADDPEEGPPQDPGAAGFCLSVRRAPLDALLLEVARAQATVDVAQPASASEVLNDDGRVVGLKLREAGREREVRAKIVIGADGRHSLVARSVGAPAARHEAASRTLYYRYVRGWTGPDGGEPDAPEFSLHGDELAYIFPSDAGTTCVAISLPKAEFQVLRADPDGELERRLAVHARLAGPPPPIGGARADPKEVRPRPAGSERRQGPGGRSSETPGSTRIRGAASGWTWPGHMQRSLQTQSATGSPAGWARPRHSRRIGNSATSTPRRRSRRRRGSRAT